MTFNLKDTNNLPVFDSPSDGQFNQRGFTFRRVLSLAARPVFSGKNLPVSPSTDYKFRKCYAISNDKLFVLEKALKVKPEKPFTFSFGHIGTDFSINEKCYLAKEKLFHHSISPYIDTLLSEQIDLFKAEENYRFSPLADKELSLVYEKEIDIQKEFSYPKPSFDFIWQSIKAPVFTDILFDNNHEIRFNRGIPKNPNLSTNENVKRVFHISQIETCFFDFTNFSVINRLSWCSLVSKAELKFHQPYLEIKERLKYREEDCDLLSLKAYPDELQPELKHIRQSFMGKESYSNFAIDVARSLLPKFDIRVKSLAKVGFSNITKNIEFKPRKAFKTRAFKTYIHDFYSEPKLEKTPKSLFEPQTQSFDSCINRDNLANIIILKNNRLEERFIKPKHRYRASDLSLVYNLEKAVFHHKTIYYYLLNLKSFNKAIKCKELNNNKPGVKKKDFALKASFQRILFNHQSPMSFETQLDSNSLKIPKRIRVRKFAFGNKCPKHGKYTFKLTHRILCANSFKKSKKFRFNAKAFSVPMLPSLSKPLDIYNNRLIEIPGKLAYNQGLGLSNMKNERPMVTSIHDYKKQKQLAVDKTLSCIFTERKRLNPIRLQKLRRLIFKLTRKETNYSLSFLKPTKRIIGHRINALIESGSQELRILKNLESIYSRQNRRTDLFEVISNNSEYKYSPYVPKEIKKNLDLTLYILGIEEVTNLSQKEIIPPPGWKKLSKKYNCKLHLQPHPFGFPSFVFGPPLFEPLVSRESYGIKDTNISKVTKESAFYLAKEKPFLPELSMKGPRRLLYPDSSVEKWPKEFYEVYLDEKALKQSEAQAIPSFKQSWEADTANNNLSEPKQRFAMSEKPRFRSFQVENESLLEKLFSAVSKYEEDMNSALMPYVKYFLLRSRKFKATNLIGQLNLNHMENSWQSIFSSTNIKTNKASQADRKLLCPMKVEKDWTFQHSLPYSFDAEEIPSTYMAMYRSFHFPYVPQNKFVINLDIYFDRELDLSKDCKCKFQEDFRVSEFEFTNPEISDYSVSDYYINEKAFKQKICSFGSETAQLMKDLELNLYEMQITKPDIHNKALPKYHRQVISPNFFKIKEAHSFKYMRRGKTTTNFRFVANEDSLLGKCKYYCLIDALPQRFDLTNYHWVIMMTNNDRAFEKFLTFSYEDISLVLSDLQPEYQFNKLFKEVDFNETDIRQLPNKFVQPEKVVFPNYEDESKKSLGILIEKALPMDIISQETNGFEILFENNAVNNYAPIKSLDFAVKEQELVSFAPKGISSNAINRVAHGEFEFQPFSFVAETPKTFASKSNAFEAKSDYRVFIPDIIDFPVYERVEI